MGRGLRVLAGAAMGAALAASTLASPAHASGPVSANAFCVATSGWYWGGLDCSATASGGTGSYTYTWSTLSYPYYSFAGPADVRIGCNPGSWSYVQVTVTDSAGQSATAVGGDWCNGPEPV